MSEFSITRSVLEESRTLGASVRTMGSTEALSTEGELSITEFEARVGAMRVWCRSVEKLLLDRRFEGTRVHAGFERLTRIDPVLHRYRRLAADVDALTVYGIADRALDVPGMRVVELTGGPLANEWFVVVQARGFGALVVAEDLDGFGGGPLLHERRFRGLVSHHPQLVAFAMRRLDAFCDAIPSAAATGTDAA